MIKVAIAIPARNEEKNIRQLLDALLNEFLLGYLEGKIFIFTDAPTDNTTKIVKQYAKSQPNILTHIHTDQNKGKIHGLNTLLTLIKQQDFDYIVAMDGDVKFEKQTLKTLVNYMEKHKDVLGATPVRLPIIAGNYIQRLRCGVIGKKTRFIAECGGYRYLTGLMNITRGIQTYKAIEEGNMHDDIYLNLVIPYEKIGVCSDCTVYYDYKSTHLNQLKYKHREGRAFRALKRASPELYKEQKRRVSFTNYYLKGGLGNNLGKFLAELTLSEKLIFILEVVINGAGFASGYLYEEYFNNKNDPLSRSSWGKLR